MNSYSIALFLHIVGALGFFVALGLEWTGLSQIRSALTLEGVRAWMGVLKSVRKFGFTSMLTTVITGLYLMLTFWGGRPWLYVTLGSLVLVIALAQVITAPRMAAIGKALFTEKGSLSITFHNLANNPLLWISIQARVAIILGIIFLKIAKPDLGGSLLTIGITIIIGIASTLPVARREHAQEGLAD
jgi:hypothetical protein